MTCHYESEAWRTFDLGHPGGSETTGWLLKNSQLESADILDFCCGSGDSLIRLKQEGHRARGIDRPGVLAYAKKKHPQLKEANLIPWEEGQRLPFEDQSFDGILSECSLSIMEDQNRIVEELHRVLRGGGLLLISDMTDGGPYQLSHFDLLDWSDQSHQIKPFVARWIWMTGTRYPRTCEGDRYFCGIYRKRDRE